MIEGTGQSIRRLADLNRLRTAPRLSREQSAELKAVLRLAMKQATWFTVGIMAASEDEALETLRSIEATFDWSPMQLVERHEGEGPVFLKANQQNGDIRIRHELGLGKGVLISGQHNDPDRGIQTWGPLPLNLFNHGQSN